MVTANSGRNTPVKTTHPWEVCSRSKKILCLHSVCDEASAPALVKFLFQATDGHSDVQALSSKALYQVLVRMSGQDDLIDELGLTTQESRSIWSWTPGLKRFCLAGLKNSSDCVHCSRYTGTNLLFYSRVVVLLRKFIGDIIVRMLRRKFFALELKANSVLRGIFLPDATISARYSGMDDATERISCGWEVHLFLTDQLKIEIWMERRRLTPLESGKRLANCERLCRVKGADLEWHFDAG